MKPRKYKRNFFIADAVMCERARTIYGLLQTDLAQFTALDSTVNASFLAQYLSVIEAADVVVTDSIVRSRVVQESESVEAVMERARKKYNEVKFFTQKTFEDSLAAQQEFGFQDYRKVSLNTVKMIEFLDVLHKICVTHQAALVANGFSAAGIAEIETIMKDLSDSNTQQEAVKNERPVLTEERIVTLNKCYSMTKQVNALAQLVFRDDFAKQKQYRFYETKKKKKPKANE